MTGAATLVRIRIPHWASERVRAAKPCAEEHDSNNSESITMSLNR